jgi:hypothetical protein
MCPKDIAMKLKQIIETLDAAPLFTPEGWEELDIKDVFASDLISDILVSEGDDQLLLTSLTSPQVVRTAALVGAVAIILVHRRQTPPDLSAAARAQNIPLFRSAITKFDACITVGRMKGEL